MIKSATYCLARGPLEVVDAAIEANLEGDVRAGNLPGVAVAQPDVGQLLLVALLINGLQVSSYRSQAQTFFSSTSYMCQQGTPL